jgi:hypothetical protein
MARDSRALALDAAAEVIVRAIPDIWPLVNLLYEAGGHRRLITAILSRSSGPAARVAGSPRPDPNCG